jgi:hypothetical protein
MWLMIGLAVAGVVVAGAVLWLLLRPSAPPAIVTPTMTPTPSEALSPSASPSVTASASPSASPGPVETPIASPPAVPDPDIATFRRQVGGWLDDAGTGLDIVSRSSGQDAVSVIDALKADAQRLSDAPAPSSIATEWREQLSSYESQLVELGSAASEGGTPPVDEARSSLQSIRALVGL